MSASLASNTKVLGDGWESEFLSWYADLGFPLLEKRLKLGSIEYFHFSSCFEVADGRTAYSFGSDQNRMVAALKCAAEAIERMEMVKYFTNQPDRVPRTLRNSNGWAVHQSVARAHLKAELEAIERHLLLKSYLAHNWQGFRFIQSINSDEVTLKLLTSRYVAQGLIAGIVVAQSPTSVGVSFGYTVGKISDVGSAQFWQPALFEAVDKLLVSVAVDANRKTGQSWIRRENDRFLAEPFQIDALDSLLNDETIETDLGPYSIDVFNVGSDRGLCFPLFAAYARGGNLIPLFWKSELDDDGKALVLSVLNRNDIAEIPERHPIL